MNLDAGRLARLAGTLAFARRRIPRYQGHAYDIVLRTADDLARLPIVTKAELVAEPESFTSTDEWPCGVQYTSGTLTALPRPRWRSSAEVAALAELPHDDEGETTLVVHPYSHGPVLAGPAETGTVYAGLLLGWHYHNLLSILRDGWRSPQGVRRIDRINCNAVSLRTLTTWLERTGVSAGSFGVRYIESHGSLQPRVWRRRLEDAWGAEYQDLFGLTEVTLSTARQCFICGAYHFVGPVVAEVVHPVSRQPLDRGVGVLVLSELYPYAQLQLLLRYWTDDLVEIASPCPAFGFGFRVVGRLPWSAVIDRADGGPPVVVGNHQVNEVCWNRSDVALSASEHAPWAPDVGIPRCRVRASAGQVDVTVELRYSTNLYRDQAAEAANQIRASLLGTVSGLAEALLSGRVELRVETVDCGTIADWGPRSRADLMP